MKKFFAALLAALLLLTMFPAAAEAPALDLPMTLTEYQQNYTTILTELAPDCTVTWTCNAMESGDVWMAVVNDSFVSVMALAVEGQVQELAVIFQSTLDESSLMTFLSMAGYAGAALLRSETVSSEDACSAFVNELFVILSAINDGQQPQNVYGLPGGISITADTDGAYQYYFALSLLAE